MKTDFGFVLEYAEAAFEECSANGNVSMPLKQMPFGKVFGIRDPAGQPHYVVELARHRPSQQVGEAVPAQLRI
jgi:hypothetical protein